MKKALWQKRLENSKVQCLLCPRNCIISNKRDGFCFGRVNHNGILYAKNYGQAVTIAIDPIEKKPLFHFLPGTDILSTATYGCNMRCPFCQNYEISQVKTPTTEITPENLIEIAKNKKLKSIAFTYTEPFIWYEMVLDTSKIAKDNGIKIILVTNGLINSKPLEEIIPYIDAMNIDLKSMDAKVYKKILSGDLSTVQNTIKTSFENGIHIEITNLIVTGMNDKESDISDLIDWVVSLSPDIPIHFSKYSPNYQYKEPPTSPEILEYAYEKAKEKLNFVYTGNVIAGKENTYCPKCNELLIERNYFNIKQNRLINGKCPSCGKKIYGFF
jgi:pyruvate formate lyase activating enzyme